MVNISARFAGFGGDILERAIERLEDSFSDTFTSRDRADSAVQGVFEAFAEFYGYC
jgi:hypothetical protein